VWSYRVSATQCVSCNRCTKVCPSAAITVPQIRATAVLDASLCHQCGDCSRSCHKDAITYTRRQV
jgi:ferredoxin